MHPDTGPSTDEEIVDAFFRAWKAGGEGGGSSVDVHFRCGGDPEREWSIICRLVERAPLELVPDIGTGELENFIHRQAGPFIDRMERQAAGDRFRLALANVWLSRGTWPPDVEDRLVRASGGELLIVDVTDDDAPA